MRNWKRLQNNPETEQKWIQEEPGKALVNAVVLYPEGTQLSETAIQAIRHMRYYQDETGGLVLFSDQEGVAVEAASIEEMIENAQSNADAMLGSMPDFEPYTMDDGCGLLAMNCEVYGFRPYRIASFGSSFPLQAMDVRAACIEACEEQKIVAVVYHDQNDFERYNGSKEA